MYDVIIVGGGPAGLSAALVLGRCRRNVLVIDAGRPRNRDSRAMHNYLSRDGANPIEFLELSRRDLEPYPVEFLTAEVIAARMIGGDSGGLARRFEVETRSGVLHESRKLVIATGLVDDVPRIDGALELYGRSVHHCPYCDAWQWRDQPIAALGAGDAGARLALQLLCWSDDVLLLTNGDGAGGGAAEPLSAEALARLDRFGISIRRERITRLEGQGGMLERIQFEDGASARRSAIFFAGSPRQSCDLAAGLGCVLNEHGGVETDDRERAGPPGLFVVGDASKEVQFVIVAASEGAMAAVAINRELQDEEGSTI